MHRREFLKTTAEAAAFFYFSQFVSLTQAWGKPVKPVVEKWLKEIFEISAAAQGGRLTPQDWQAAVERLHAKISLEDVVRFVDLDSALKRMNFPKKKLAAIAEVKLPSVEGFPDGLDFGHMLFAYRKGAITPPHAHNHLVSAHLVIKGKILVRTFDRVQDLDKAILLKPTGRAVSGVGSVVSMSDYRNNAHGFEGVGDLSVSFNVHIPQIEPGKPYRHEAESHNQIYVDTSVAPRPDGLLEAPIVKFSDLVRRLS